MESGTVSNTQAVEQGKHDILSEVELAMSEYVKQSKCDYRREHGLIAELYRSAYVEADIAWHRVQVAVRQFWGNVKYYCKRELRKAKERKAND